MVEAEEAPAISNFAQGEVVTISIGPEKRLYNVHKDLICHYSDYFRAAYNGRWKEADEGVALDDVKPGVFNIFLHWMYTQKFPQDDESIVYTAYTYPIDESLIPGEGKFFALKSCVFGDRFLAPKFRIDAHNTCVELHRDFPPLFNHIIYAFEHLHEDDILLNFFVDLHSAWWEPSMDSEDEVARRAHLPHAFLVRTMIRTFAFRKVDASRCFDPSVYTL